MEKRHLEISWSSLWKIVLMLALVTFFYFTRNIIVSVILSIVISSAFDPVVSFLERKKIPRILGTLLVFLFLFGSISFLLYIIVPLVLSELNVLIDHLTEIQSSIFGLSEVSQVIKNINSDISQLANILFSGNTSVSDVISSFFGGIALAFSVFVLSFYLTVDRDGVEKFLMAILPPEYEDKVLDIYFRTRAKIGKWLLGQVFLSMSVGLSVSVGLWFLGIKYSLVLGIFAGLVEIAPFVGPIFSGAMAVIIAFSQSFNLALYTLILFVVIQQIENQLLVPIFMKLTTSLHPAVILIALLIGGQLFGVVGLILAVPTAVLAQEVINNWSASKIKRKATIS